jgi:hypothetical protein
MIVIHGNQTDEVPSSYKKYLEKTFRRELQLIGTPVRIEFRTGENPFADKRAELERPSVRQRRLLAAKGLKVATGAKVEKGTKADKSADKKPAARRSKTSTAKSATAKPAVKKAAAKRPAKAAVKKPIKKR